MKTILLALSLSLMIGCSSNQKNEVVYTSSPHEQWKSGVMERCKMESVMLVLISYETAVDKENWTAYDIGSLERKYLVSCYNHYKIII